MQSTLQDMRKSLDEANDSIIKEKEAARIAIEEALPIIKEVPVVDSTELELLSQHNKKLEVRN